MKRHGFHFGTAANVRYLRQGAAVDLRDAEIPLGRRPVGLRFRLDVARGVNLTSAYLQFTSSESGQDSSRLDITIHDVNDAPDFREQDISSRNAAADAVAWSPSPWNSAGERGAAQRSPDLAELVEAQTGRADWEEGQHVAFLINGTGSRNAFSFDAGSSQAASLVLTYEDQTVEIPVARLEDDAEEIEGAEDTARYREELLRLFNYVTFENALKWHRWNQDAQSGIDAAAWAASHEVTIRGHTLVWSSSIPDDVEARLNEPDYVREQLEEDLVERVTAMKDKVVAWDVLNEPLHRQELENVLGFEDRLRWFHLAAMSDPNARLFINDYGILEGGVRYEEYKQVIRALIDDGAPVEGIGVQGHFWSSQPSQQQLWNRLESLAELDLPIEITEFDMNAAWSPIKQADHMEKLLVTAFSHPSVTAFIMWGFWDGRHWRGNAPLFNRNWTLKPSGEVWTDLVYNQWWTDETVVSNADGEVALRGFLGDYDIEVTVENTSHVLSRLLSADGSSFEVQLPFATNADHTPPALAGALFSLSGHYPNPTSGNFVVSFDLDRNADIGISVFDVLGREVLRIPDRRYDAGMGRMAVIDLTALTAGTYMYRVTATAIDQVQIATERVVVLR